MELEREYVSLLQKIQKKEIREDELEEFITKAEKVFQKEANACLSFNHVIESYYYEYFVSKEPFTEVPVNMGLLYRSLGDLYKEERKLRKAETAYNRSYRWNPVDLDTIYTLIEYHKQEADLEHIYKLTEKCYPFCCSRADLAHYYRNLGFYYLESYDPTTAKALYEYSNLFYHTEQADHELAYIKQAIKQQDETVDVAAIQSILSEKQIPIQANETTIALTYQLGMAFLKQGDSKRAKDCLVLVYDVTQDEEIKEMLYGGKVF